MTGEERLRQIVREEIQLERGTRKQTKVKPVRDASIQNRGYWPSYGDRHTSSPDHIVDKSE